MEFCCEKFWNIEILQNFIFLWLPNYSSEASYTLWLANYSSEPVVVIRCSKCRHKGFVVWMKIQTRKIDLLPNIIWTWNSVYHLIYSRGVKLFGFWLHSWSKNIIWKINHKTQHHHEIHTVQSKLRFLSCKQVHIKSCLIIYRWA